MDAETVKRLALKMLTNRNAVPVLVDLDPFLTDVANASANPGRKWPVRMTDWCMAQGLGTESLDALRDSLKDDVVRADERAERERAIEAYKRFAERLKGLAYGVESQLKFGPDYASEWVRKANIGAERLKGGGVMKWDSERQLCEVFRQHVESEGGVTVYNESAGWDMLLVREFDGFQTGVQAKLKANLDVLWQVVNTRRNRKLRMKLRC
jgi:hypothetical protein